MNIYYAKTILYAYSHVDKIVEQLDELVEKKALSSYSDFTPALSQCEKVIELSYQKENLLDLKEKVFKILKKFSEYDLSCIEYKYFRTNEKKLKLNIDSASRKYFRHQISIAKNFALYLEKAGIDDLFFEREFLITDFFKDLLKNVIYKEQVSYKNKGKTGDKTLKEEKIKNRMAI